MRREIPRILGTTIAAACAATAVAACGTTHATPGPAAPVASRSSSPSPSPAATPRQRAQADAAAILASFVAPPGARRLPAAPAVDGGVLKTASDFPVSTALVDDTSWWLAPGQPQSLLTWEEARLPRQFAAADSSSAWDPSFGQTMSDTFSLPPVSGVLNTRDLVVEVVSAGSGQTAIRVDAQVTWQPPRPAAERVPSAARVVTISQLPSLLPHGKRPPASVTITDAAVTKRIAALVDQLPVSTLGVVSCPAMIGGGLELTFRAKAGGPALAVVNSEGSCDTVLFTLAGTQQPALTGSGSLVAQVLKTAGLRWHVIG
jgi:hypothetical protein